MRLVTRTYSRSAKAAEAFTEIYENDYAILMGNLLKYSSAAK
jgi:hypothetical protein